jgi:hypothetical protein
MDSTRPKKKNDRRVLEERIQQQQDQKVNIPVRYPPCNNFDVRKLQPGEICETIPPPKWALLEKQQDDRRRVLMEEVKLQQITIPTRYSPCPSDINKVKSGEICENSSPMLAIDLENNNKQQPRHLLNEVKQQQQKIPLQYPPCSIVKSWKGGENCENISHQQISVEEANGGMIEIENRRLLLVNYVKNLYKDDLTPGLIPTSKQIRRKLIKGLTSFVKSTIAGGTRTLEVSKHYIKNNKLLDKLRKQARKRFNGKSVAVWKKRANWIAGEFYKSTNSQLTATKKKMDALRKRAKLLKQRVIFKISGITARSPSARLREYHALQEANNPGRNVETIMTVESRMDPDPAEPPLFNQLVDQNMEDEKKRLAGANYYNKKKDPIGNVGGQTTNPKKSAFSYSETTIVS